jgi:Protein of unknown function (DUF3078)
MKFFFTLLLAVICLQTHSFAQTEAPKTEKPPKDWTIIGSFGLDLTGLGLINPKLGGGDSRLGLGGLIALSANLKKPKYFWNNNGGLQLSAQRIGGKSADFQKSLDILRLGSRLGYRILGDKLFVALDGTAESQLLKTYSGNFLNGVDSNLLSEFLSPARFAIAPGLDIKATKELTFFLSPASFNLTYIGNDNLAALEGQPLGNEAGKNNRSQVGFSVKAQYVNKFFKDRIAFASKVAWFADYKQNLNGNVLWQNILDIQIVKGLALGLLGDVFYDHFTLVQVEKAPADASPAELGQYLGLKPSLTGGFLLKYNAIF